MKEIKLTIDGKEIALTEEQIRVLGIYDDEKDVCSRVEDGEYYYSIGVCGTVDKIIETSGYVDCELYNYGNYYNDRAYAKQVALHQNLNNLLRRYSEQHGGDLPWDGKNQHFTILFDVGEQKYFVSYFYDIKEINLVYFSSCKIAESAIEEIIRPFIAEHPGFVL